MEILLVTPYYPFPAEKTGGTHTINMIIRNMSNCLIDIFYYGERKEDEIYFSNNIKNIHHEYLKADGLKQRIKSIFLRQSYTSFMYKKKSKVLDDLLRLKEYDYILFDQFSSMKFAKKVDSKKILFMHDCIPMLFKRKISLSESIYRKWYYKLQYKFVLKEEMEYYDQFEKIIFVSQKDIEYEKKIHGRKKYSYGLCNLGIDLQIVKSAPQIRLDKNSIIFTGIMDYEPNEDAMIYFVEHIFDKVVEKVPTVTLYIVGKNPTKKLLKTVDGKENIIVTGKVDNIFTFIKAAQVYISPLRFGSGKKNKIIEAISCARPIIASTVSLEGFDDIIEKNIIRRADSDEEWVENIIELLNDTQECARISREVEKLIDNTYSWKKIADSVFAQLK